MSQSLADQRAASMLYGGNADFVESLYEQYLRDPAGLEPEWRAYFAALGGAGRADVAHGPIRERLLQRFSRPGSAAASATRPAEDSDKQAAVSRLIQVYRTADI